MHFAAGRQPDALSARRRPRRPRVGLHARSRARAEVHARAARRPPCTRSTCRCASTRAGAGSLNAVEPAIIWRVRRAAALWLVLFAAYAATIGLPAFGDSQFAGDEPHYLLTAESIVSDRDLDVRDEYAARAYRDWYPYLLERRGRLTSGQANEPTGAGFALLIAPAYAIGGPTAVQLLLAAIAALAFVLGGRAGAADRARAVGRAARRSPAACRRRRSPTRPPSPRS